MIMYYESRFKILVWRALSLVIPCCHNLILSVSLLKLSPSFENNQLPPSYYLFPIKYYPNGFGQLPDYTIQIYGSIRFFLTILYHSSMNQLSFTILHHPYVTTCQWKYLNQYSPYSLLVSTPLHYMLLPGSSVHLGILPPPILVLYRPNTVPFCCFIILWSKIQVLVIHSLLDPWQSPSLAVIYPLYQVWGLRCNILMILWKSQNF